ncbi:MAG: twin-arginine translocase subunit TatC [Halolamina sp.]|uniref:twin-arginine translocase subunit TatC n=1 Tax=Halolamina sp. TaxID=1940283 RepID=UPI002FC2B524
MSSALDDDTQRALADGRETAAAMLRSAQKDLQKVFIVFLIGFLGTFYALRLWIWDYLRDVTIQRMSVSLGDQFDIIAQTPFDVILLQAKIALVAGIIIGIPPLIYFSRDALRERDMWPQSPVPIWKLVGILLMSGVLFMGGMAYGYLLFFPIMFEFLAGNALAAGFAPHWSIVKWTEFIFLLTVSFGLAAQMPLAITALSYAGIVPYETFREQWRYAVVAIFVFGAFFSPPDPFTQVMWAAPLLVLYGFSLYLAKFAVTMRRGSERLSATGVAARNWNFLAALFVGGVALLWAFSRAGGHGAANSALTAAGSSYRVPVLGDTETIVAGILLGLVLAVGGLLYAAYKELEALVGPDADTEMGDPTGIDLEQLDEAGVRAAPSESFAAMTEPEALEAADTAINNGHHAKAQAILDRFDEAHEPDPDAPEPPTHETEPLFTPVSLFGAIRRGREWVDWQARASALWNLLAGIGVLLFGIGYALVAYPDAVESLLSRGGLTLSVPATGLGTTPAIGVVAGGTLLVLGLLVGIYYLLASYFAGTDPTAVDVSTLSAEEIERAPPALFAEMSEPEANFLANQALEAGDEHRARVLFDRFDDAQANAHLADEGGEADESAPGSVGDRSQRAGSTFLEELTDGETDEDDIGGYYRDIRFIFDAITSGAFYIVGVFMVVLASTFAWLYTGGIGDVYAGFLRRVPNEVLKPGQTAGEAAKVIALHPVEALVFEVKFSALVAGLVVLPMIAYYAWPALRDKGFVRGRREVIFGWAGLLLAGLLGGLVFGYLFVAPTVISFLVEDALAANMTISYRITDFFWLIFFTTAGIGLLADVPVLMVLLNTAGVSYGAMRSRWREVMVGILLFAALFTPADVITMFLVTVPLMVAYGTGLGLLYLFTLGGRRNLARPIVTQKSDEPNLPGK